MSRAKNYSIFKKLPNGVYPIVPGQQIWRPGSLMVLSLPLGLDETKTGLTQVMDTY